jgi:two-component system OmpR family sensor kinase
MGKLFWKILLTFWLTLLVAGGATGLSVWLHQSDLQMVEEDLVIRPSSVREVRAAANTLRFGGKEALRNLLLEQQQNAPENLQVYAVDATGKEMLGRTVLADTLDRIRQTTTKPVAPPIARTVEMDGESYVLFAPKSGQFPEYPTSKRNRNRRPPRSSDWILVLTGVLASFISSFLLAWYFAKPIGSLRKAFRALAAGDLTQRVAPAMGSRRDELADLGRDFDDMATQLQNLMSSQRRLLHDVSHELRSPLARLQVSIGLARQQPEKVASSLERIEQEAGRLDTLVGEVLTLSRLESGTPQRTDEYLDILELLDTLMDDARFEAKALSCHVSFQCELEDSPVIQGHGELLYRALENVLRNAIHHTPPDTTVTLGIRRNVARDCLHITVDDQGPGVPAAELASIFEPFQRSSNGNPARNGYGLGLAIARRAIESHGGSIRASNRPERGLRVEIILPIR